MSLSNFIFFCKRILTTQMYCPSGVLPSILIQRAIVTRTEVASYDTMSKLSVFEIWSATLISDYKQRVLSRNRLKRTLDEIFQLNTGNISTRDLYACVFTREKNTYYYNACRSSKSLLTTTRFFASWLLSIRTASMNVKKLFPFFGYCTLNE